MPKLILTGSICSAALTDEAVTVSGNYYRYDNNRRVKASGAVTVDLLNILRVGVTKTYSRRIFAVPMTLGALALLVRAIPSIGYEKDIIEDIYSVGVTLWSLPHQDFIWKLLAVACVLTIPLYWLSYRNDLEINTARGRYLLPRKGMDKAAVETFQRAVYLQKESCRKEAKAR